MRTVLIAAAVILVTLVAVAAVMVRFGRPHGGMGGTPPADPPAAKLRGDELLASTDTTVLVFIAHPDDAEWWIGGTLGMLAERNRVVVVLGTSGDAGNGGFQSDLGEIREKLQLEGAKMLGYADVVFLRHPDGHLGEAEEYPGEVAALVEKEDPATVITFDTDRESGGYQHVDHEAAGRAALATARARGGIGLYLFHSSAPDVISDMGPMAEKKAEALSLLASYHDTSPFGWLSSLARSSGAEREVISYGGRSRFPEVGVEYGELFRREMVPAR
jgi:LmbE family N-acetylglucosaminyl deacetylase